MEGFDKKLQNGVTRFSRGRQWSILIACILLIGITTFCSFAATEKTGRETRQGVGGSITLGEYKGISLTKTTSTVSEAEIEAVITNLLNVYTEYELITDRPAQAGDRLLIDYVGWKDGVEIKGGSNQNYYLNLGSGIFVPGFESGLIGSRSGETVRLELVFPENYMLTEFSGEQVVFEVVVKKIYVIKAEVFNDAFVQKISTHKTTEEFRAAVKDSLVSEKKRVEDKERKSEAFRVVIANSEFLIEESAVSQMYEQALSQNSQTINELGDSAQAELLKMNIRSACENEIKKMLVILAIADAEKIAVQDNDRKLYADRLGLDLTELLTIYEEKEIDLILLEEKVIQFVLDHTEPGSTL